MKNLGKRIYLILIILFLYLPILTLMVFSFNNSKSMSIWTGFSLKWYKEMLGNSMIMEAIWNTFTIALAAAAIATIVGTLACIGIMAMKKRSETVIMGLNNIPLLNADIVTGISLMMTFLVFGISLNWGTVLLSHITFCIPYVILSVMPKFKQLAGQHLRGSFWIWELRRSMLFIRWYCLISDQVSFPAFCWPLPCP